MLKTRVLSFGVLTDDSKVDVGVTRGEARKGLAKNHRRVNVELLTHGDVPRYMPSLGDRGEQNTYETTARSVTARWNGHKTS